MLLRTCDLGEYTHLHSNKSTGDRTLLPSATRFSALRQGTFKSTGLKSESDTRTRDMACIQDFHRCQASTELSLSNASVALGDRSVNTVNPCVTGTRLPPCSGEHWAGTHFPTEQTTGGRVRGTGRGVKFSGTQSAGCAVAGPGRGKKVAIR